MQKSTKKVLVIRFNSIGDIVLTTPVVEALHKASYEVHYLVKGVFKEILETNPYVYKIWTIKDRVSEVTNLLKKEGFDVVVDLHNNIRSLQVKQALKVRSLTLKKNRVPYYLLTKFGVNSLFNRVKERHIVYRFLDVLGPLGIAVGEPTPHYYISSDVRKSLIKLKLPDKYIVIVTGAAWATKQIPVDKIVDTIDQLPTLHIILIGGPADMNTAMGIMKSVRTKQHRQVINLTGQLSISQSAAVIEKSTVVLSGDTGMMHIAASLGISVVGVFGSTHPILGYTPFYSSLYAKQPISSIVQNDTLNCRPCTKQGQDKCPKGHFKCMNDIPIDSIIQKLKNHL